MSHFKRPTIKSPAIRKSAAFKTCTLRWKCNGKSDGTVVAAHLNSQFKGTGNKSPDLFTIRACHDCHQALDRLQVPAEAQMRAFQETLMQYYEEGLIRVQIKPKDDYPEPNQPGMFGGMRK